MANKYDLTGVEVNITEDELEEMKESFSMFDKNKDGTIDGNELTTVMRALGSNPTKAEVEKFIENIDTNENGTVEFKEFVVMMEKLARNVDAESELRESFKVFDKDGSGKISASEIKYVMTSLGERLSIEEAEEMISEADANRDGEIDYEEFVQMMMKDTKKKKIDSK